MCGIAGAIASEESIDELSFRKMLELMKHRGPDDEGIYLAGKAALGNRRLSILDVSEKGHQPMFFRNLVLVMNGEIYNYREIRKELEEKGYSFVSDSDTEVALKAISDWGLEEAVRKFIGMFAILLYDSEKGKICGVRDRFGIKPLHYAKVGGKIYFSSEIKAFSAVMELKPNLKRIAEYLSFRRSPSRETFFEGVFSVPPASLFCTDGDRIEFNSYWKLEAREKDWEIEKAISEWRKAFEESVKLHLRTDVPLAIALSGGLDSSALLAFAKILLDGGLKERGFSDRGLKIFTVSVDEESIDESRYAVEIAGHLGLTENLEVIKVGDGDLKRIDLHRMIYFLEEPPEGPSSILHWVMMEKVREKSKDLKVLLNGQGGDELLAGYHAYIPIYLKELLRKKGILRAIAEAWKLRSYIYDKFTLGMRVFLGLRKKVVEGMLTEQARMLLRETNASEKAMGLNDALRKDLTGGRLLEILRTEDRSSMAYSIEIRVPYVNHILAELSLSFPSDLKIRDGYTKWIHRKAAEQLLPHDIVWSRRKIGFQAPERKWLLSLEDMFSELMESSKLVEAKILRPEAVRELTDRVRKKKISGDYARIFWRILFAELWMRVYFGSHGLHQSY
ncbi:MAG: asparagine synthase (glutamine-hydrolyzing) [Fervidicoccaceae archaeon]|uniref:Putative asparagine synthetase [glutamine-hydrolyzing] n=1 Tax=Fervidicoccus fontis TaxID=683846 RepID=A0A7C2UJR6_9CREN|nr:MAG: asparagine synthase (glutamine-hydrolyzing) [Fervidicoccus sp.]HEU97962.1 asparagine synthase (glutamine-hydrolyzing) [Fervidicoccus fontis]